MTARRLTHLAVASVAVGATLLAAPLSASAMTSSDRGNSSDSQGSGRGESGENGNNNRLDPFTIGVWGDQGYKSSGISALPKVIAGLNAQPLAFTVYDGDIKAGKDSLCDDALYSTTQANFNSVNWPTFYTPGDNEWTDCDRITNGNLDPNERLAHIRSVFFQQAKSQGKTTLSFTRQSEAYPENARWDKNGITFITVNTPGTDNNYPQTKDGAGILPIDTEGALTSGSGRAQNGDFEEYYARNAANLAWLKDGFRYAKERNSKGIMIIQQADMWATNGDVITHYGDEKNVLAKLVGATTVPVALVNGDTHVYAVDNPLLGSTGATFPNFQRLTTDGDQAFGWTKVDINPAGPAVFTFTQMKTP